MTGRFTDPLIGAEMESLVKPGRIVLVAIASDHTYAYVQEEMEVLEVDDAGSYMVVFNGVMEIPTDSPNSNPEWITDSPAAEVWAFLVEYLEVDRYCIGQGRRTVRVGS